MRRANAVLTTVAAALALGGCASSASTSSKDFKGQEKAVAEVVDDLSSAGQRKDAGKICSDVLSAKLAERLKSGGNTCADEIDKAITDADNYDLTVTDVSVSGATATAKVRQGDDGPTTTFEFAKERDGWRATSLG